VSKREDFFRAHFSQKKREMGTLGFAELCSAGQPRAAVPTWFLWKIQQRADSDGSGDFVDPTVAAGRVEP
jgi:hypothetical protein